MSPRAFEGRYKPEPLNTGSGLDAKIDDRVQQFIQSAQFTGAAVPQSIPQQSVMRPVVTDLPTGAVDGDEVRYVADGANGVVWLLRYRDTGGSYPWEFLGGGDLYASDTTTTAGTTTSASYGGLTSLPDLGITAPLAGDYKVCHGAAMWLSTGANDVGLQSFAVGATAASDVDAIEHSPGSTGGTDQHQTSSVIRRAAAVHAGDLINLRWRVTGGATAAFRQRFLTVTPVRVGLS